MFFNDISINATMGLIDIDRGLALIAPLGASEKPVSAIRAKITGFFVFDPFVGAVLAPVGDCPHDDFFADGYGKVVDMPAGKIIAFMAALIPLLLSAVSDVALLAETR